MRSNEWSQRITWLDAMITLVALGAMLTLGWSLWFNPSPIGSQGFIKTPNGVIEFDLDTPQTQRVKGILGDSLIRIEHGQAHFVLSPCRHKFCVRKGPLNRLGDAAFCLPNGVSVHIKDPRYDIDAVNF